MEGPMGLPVHHDKDIDFLATSMIAPLGLPVHHNGDLDFLGT